MIGKRDIERRIDPQRLNLIEGFRRKAIEEGRWNEETIRQYHELLMPDFRSELRILVKERLMLQEAKERHLEIDKVAYQKRLDRRRDELRRYGLLGNQGFRDEDVQAFVREQMLVQEFQGTLVTALDLPNKPQVEAYYRANQTQYTRAPMAMLRLIKVNSKRVDGTGKTIIDEDPYGHAEELRKDVVDRGIAFADLAKDRSDDRETRARGGLMVGPEGEPYIDPEQNRFLAPEVRKLRTDSAAGRTSKVFEMDNGWAIVFLEERRPAGPAPLDSALYDKIRDTLVQEVVKRREKEWFLGALKRSLILDGSPTPKPIPVSFFFPEDPTLVDGPAPSAQNGGASGKKPSSKER
jgi:parvulin-like peptidyl-prolyl isomerase